MSKVVGKPARPRHGRWFDLFAMLAIGVVVVGAALAPVFTANSGETTTVRGDVRLDGRPLAFFPVGFWTTAGVQRGTTTRTDASGRFTMDVPVTAEGWAYAGAAPDAEHAIVTTDGEQVVRGVIGAKSAAPISTPLYQGWAPATARSLAGGASQLHFTLQQPGRLAGTSPVAAGRLRSVQVRRLDGSVVQTLTLDSRGRFRSIPLAPGDYAVVLVAKAPQLPSVATGTVRGGRTTTVTITPPVTGATLTGEVRTTSRALGAGIPVLLEQAGDVLAATTTASTGAWTFTGIAAGDYTVEVGRYDEADAVSASAIQVPIPGATSTPTPTPTVATPSPTAATPQGAAVEPVQRTADGVRAASFDATVPTTLDEVGVATVVTEAARISGSVLRPDIAAGTEGATTRVVVEEAATGRIVRATTAAPDGAYAVGGLEPGRDYTVWAVTEPDDPTLAEMGSATVAAETTPAIADIVIDQDALTLGGTVSAATGGTVTAGDTALFARSTTIDASGGYAIQGLVPGAYPVIVAAKGRKAAEPVGVVVSTSRPVVDLQPGPRPATFQGWFISGGAGVPIVSGTAEDPDGDVVRFGPRAEGGHVEITDLAAGTYTYVQDSFRGTVATLDGPWFFLAPTGTFSLSEGDTVDVGPIVLHLRAR